MTTTMIAKAKALISTVTPDELDRAHEVYDFQKQENFYQVASSRDLFDENGDRVMYEVRYDRVHKCFTCSCPAGAEAFIHCRNGFCRHVVIALAAADEIKAANVERARWEAEIAEQTTRACRLEINGQVADKETYDRIMNAPVKVDRTAKARQIPAFSLLR